ncbi:glycerophosphodiester phosphodiesterase family protein [Thermococcus sp. MAR1]|uniref:glycerophosphodiester phosphodiesterase family protein n=1 Tax=Thermococcus sp. MAR1 TaxID=1638263 RepID=UPI00143BD9EC|nr:glycerophosphodiester phosphodiesterase family protein [Thermococcus sp. MAR1]NJE09834.1 glycerophosphodiester phosphodiesterase [Thermococcus sp. MAR1]
MNSELPPILGHRGFRGRLENTMPAFRRALEYADGIEFDVRLTGDGRLVAYHEDSFQANGSWYRLKELSLRELRRLHPLGSLIPTVGEVLQKFPGVLLNVDVKETDAVEKTIELVGRHKALGKAVFSSESSKIVQAIIRECPDCRAGFSIVGYSSLWWIPKLDGLYSIHVPIDAVTYIGYRPLVVLLRVLRKRGLKIYLWNYQMDELRWIPRFLSSADVIISDDPARLRKSFYAKGVLNEGDSHVGT